MHSNSRSALYSQTQMLLSRLQEASSSFVGCQSRCFTCVTLCYLRLVALERRDEVDGVREDSPDRNRRVEAGQREQLAVRRKSDAAHGLDVLVRDRVVFGQSVSFFEPPHLGHAVPAGGDQRVSVRGPAVSPAYQAMLQILLLCAL